MRWLALLPFTLAMGLLAPASARACDVVTLPAQLRDPGSEGMDKVPPVLRSSPPVVVRRGAEAATEKSDDGGCGGGPSNRSSNSTSICDGFTSILIRPSVKDDRTPGDEMGWRFRLVKGPLPSRLSLPNNTVRWLGGGLYLDWIDLPETPTGSFAFVIELVAVDGGGNVSNAIQVSIAHEVGGLPGGCAMGERHPPRPGTAFGALLLGVLVAVSWRRRPGRPRAAAACRASDPR